MLAGLAHLSHSVFVNNDIGISSFIVHVDRSYSVVQPDSCLKLGRLARGW